MFSPTVLESNAPKTFMYAEFTSEVYRFINAYEQQ